MSEYTPPATIRAWAKAQGLTVPSRGKLPGWIVDQYRAAHTPGLVAGAVTPVPEEALLELDPMRYLTWLANGNYHLDPRLRVALVGTVPRFSELVADLDRIIADHPSSHVTVGHVTNWTNPTGEVRQWSLFNNHGQTNNTSVDFDYKLAKRIVGNGRYPALEGFASSLPDLGNLRLNMLGPGAALSPHEETLPRKLDRDKVGLRARFHLPIYTSPEAIMLADDQWFHFHAGNVYLFNNGCVHAARNEGADPRYHLVWDQVMSQRAYEAMFFTGTDWITHGLADVEPVREERVSKWADEGGMGLEEFQGRELTYCPVLR